MSKNNNTLDGRTALITGAAKRIGAAVTRALHAAGMNVVIHYHRSVAEAEALSRELNEARPDSAVTAQADLLEVGGFPSLVKSARQWGSLDVLVNNASSFFPTPLGSVNEMQWDDLIGTNLKAPFFLSQAAAAELRAVSGCIINMVDIHADRPLDNYPVYCVAKAGLVMLTRSLARELGPDVRVNGIAPGAILWPEAGVSVENRRAILEATALKRAGNPADVARTVLFFVREAPYVTGQVLAVDGGRTV
ncbi:MAG: pteridine reductase [Gammaproteobacteria bacterium]|jgi:pteridine reductase